MPTRREILVGFSTAGVSTVAGCCPFTMAGITIEVENLTAVDVGDTWAVGATVSVEFTAVGKDEGISGLELVAVDGERNPVARRPLGAFRWSDLPKQKRRTPKKGEYCSLGRTGETKPSATLSAPYTPQWITVGVRQAVEPSHLRIKGLERTTEGGMTAWKPFRSHGRDHLTALESAEPVVFLPSKRTGSSVRGNRSSPVGNGTPSENPQT